MGSKTRLCLGNSEKVSLRKYHFGGYHNAFGYCGPSTTLVSVSLLTFRATEADPSFSKLGLFPQDGDGGDNDASRRLLVEVQGYR